MSGQNGVRVYIGLGSNIDGPAAQIRSGFSALANIKRVHLVAQSSLYKSAPLGPANQPHYINAVAALDTEQSPYELLAELQDIELRHGRVRGLRWGPRTLDLDIVLYGQTASDDPRLTLPHPGLAQRNFVLYPLKELVSDDFHLPGLGFINDVLARCPDGELSVIGS